MCRKFPQGLQPMSTLAAKQRIDKMVQMESRGWGDQANALGRIAKKYKVPAGTLDNIRTGRTKTVLEDIGDAIRLAYLDMLTRQVRKWQRELELERRAGHVDDDLENMEREAEDLSARLETRIQSRLRARDRRRAQ